LHIILALKYCFSVGAENFCNFAKVFANFCNLLWRYGKNRHITPNILDCPGHILTYFTGLVGTLVGMIFQIFVRQSPKGACYGNQLNMRDVRKRRVRPPLLFALAFDNGLADCKYTFKRFNGINQATSYPNLVNLRPVISEFTLLKCAVFAAIRRNLTTIFSRDVGVSKRIGKQQF